MTKFSAVVLCLIIAACSAGKPAFNYDRKNACVIDYGFDGFSVIIDKNKTLIKNNRMASAKFVTLGTRDRTYSTIGRYFSDNDVSGMINSLLNSRVVYMKWIDGGGSGISSRDVFRTTIDVADFPARYLDCQRIQSNIVK